MPDIAAILASLPGSRSGGGNTPFSGRISCDSRNIRPGDVFFAFSGSEADGARYIIPALEQGAAAVVCSAAYDGRHPEALWIQTENPRTAYLHTCRALSNNPDEHLDIFGITGTNGKTTGCWLMRSLLEASGKKCGLIGTVSNYDGRNFISADRTTPGAEQLYPLLATMVNHGLGYAAVEFSSHSLDQNRTGNLRCRAAVFTNLTGDHLDYHGTMENCYLAKRRLFTEHLASDGAAIVNCDDAWGIRLTDELRAAGIRCISFGFSPDAECRLTDAAMNREGSSFSVTRNGADERFSAPLIGKHNIYNIAGVILAAMEFGLPADEIRAALPSIPQVPGRLEKFGGGAAPAVFVDYAHTDDALKNVLCALRPLCKGKLFCVFGAGGDRDRTKRPRMGTAAAAGADKIWLTSDNPRSESPESIIAEIYAGIPADRRAAVNIEPDRRRAISAAVSEAAPEDTVLIAGKGHEDYQEISGIRHHFNDREEVRSALERRIRYAK